MCGVCISRRGMVYFGSSIHIFITLILFLGSTFRAYRISSYEREENSKQLFGAMIIATYFFTLLVLGCLIFRGVEHKSPKMLGWSGGLFITLETFAFVFNLILLSPMGGAYDEYGLRNFGFTVDILQILLSLLLLAFMAGYCVVIILYILKLREDDTGSEYTFGEFDDAGTIPAPPVATNLSRSSTAHSTYSVHHNNKNSNTQLAQTASQGHLNQCNSQYHIGHNQISSSGTHKSPLLQERRLLPRVNHLSQDRLNETNTSPHGSHYFQHQQKISPYVSNSGAVYANYNQQRGGGVPYRQTQTLPHLHHYHRHMPSTGGTTSGATQFATRSRMDLATLTQTLTRNSNLKRAVHGTSASGLPITTSVPTTSTVADSSYEGDQWEQPRVQALKYSYSGARKGVPGSTLGVEV